MKTIVVSAAVLALAQQVPPPVPPRAPVPRIDVHVDQKGADLAPWVRDFLVQTLMDWDIAPEERDVAGHATADFRVDRNGFIRDVSTTAGPELSAVKTAIDHAIADFRVHEGLPAAYPDESAAFHVTFYYQETPPPAPAGPPPPPPPGVYPAYGRPPSATAELASIVPPRLIQEVKPKYTSDAMRAKITGSVELSAIVETDGSVSSVAVFGSVDPWLGLDESALTAMKQWQFAPGTRNGEPVRTQVTVEMTFTLR
jgi:TonB family protein